MRLKFFFSIILSHLFIVSFAQNSIEEIANKEESLRLQSISSSFVPQISKKTIDVNQLSNFQEQKNRIEFEERLAKISKNKNEHPITRFSYGDIVLFQSIMDSLTIGTTRTKSNYYHRLVTWKIPKNLKEESKSILYAQIAQSISCGNDEIEKKATNCAIANKIDNYVSIVENRLGKSDKYIIPEIAYHLTDALYSDVLLSRIEESIREKNIDEKNSWKLTKSLWELYKSKKGNNNRLFDFASESIKNEYFGIEDLEFEKYRDYRYSSSNPYEALSEIVFAHKTTESLNLIKILFDRDFSKSKCLTYLVRQDYPAIKELINSTIRKNDRYFLAVAPYHFEQQSALSTYYNKTKDETMLSLALSTFEDNLTFHYNNLKNPREYILQQKSEVIINTLIQTKRIDLYSNFHQSIKDDRIKYNCELFYDGLVNSKKTNYADLMTSWGLNQEGYSNQELKILAQSKGGYNIEFYHKCLTALNRFSSFNLETGMLPLDYNRYLKKITEQSDSKLDELEFLVETKRLTKDEFSYTITIKTDEYIYTFSPRNLDDWVDASSLTYVLNEVCKDNNIAERFYCLDMKDPVAGILFGTLELRNNVLSKLK